MASRGALKGPSGLGHRQAHFFLVSLSAIRHNSLSFADGFLL
jgi:hypothetical protein